MPRRGKTTRPARGKFKRALMYARNHAGNYASRKGMHSYICNRVLDYTDGHAARTSVQVLLKADGIPVHGGGFSYGLDRSTYDHRTKAANRRRRKWLTKQIRKLEGKK